MLSGSIFELCSFKAVYQSEVTATVMHTGSGIGLGCMAAVIQKILAQDRFEQLQEHCSQDKNRKGHILLNNVAGFLKTISFYFAHEYYVGGRRYSVW